jgi:hypothetical protein
MRKPGLMIICGVLAACADPMDQVPRLSEVPVQQDTASVQALPDAAAESPAGAGFLSALFGRRGGPAAPDDAGATAPDPAAGTETDGPAPVTEIAAPAPRRPLFGFLRPAPAPETAAAPTTDPDDPADASPPEPVTAEVPAPPPPATAPQRGGGLFGFLRAGPRTAPELTDVPFGTPLPFGRIARVCDAPRSGLGTTVARFPEDAPVYRLIDSAPGNLAPHAFFVTGFSDGCPRQLTAALVMFGSAGMHEQLRYGAAAADHPYSATDEAYEKIKSQVCNVRRNRPCGARIDRMDRAAVFLSVYENYGDSPRWADILLHDGAVLAADINGG